MTSKPAFWQEADVNASATPHKLCAPCREMCKNSAILHSFPEWYAAWEQGRRAGRSVESRPPCKESYLLHRYACLEQCVNEGGCHLCALVWSERKAAAGYDPLQELRLREDDGVSLMAELVSGGKSNLNSCYLTFQLGKTASSTPMPLLLSTGKTTTEA